MKDHPESSGNETLSAQLAYFFDTPAGGATQWPPYVIKRVRSVFMLRPFGPGLWGDLGPDERRAVVAKWDADQAVEKGMLPEQTVAWYDAVLRASFWWKRASVSPLEAALLLCQFDPSDADCNPSCSENEETKPENYKELLRVFEEVNVIKPGHRRLEDWVSLAAENGLKHHSWVKKYAECVRAMSEGSLAGSVGRTHPAEVGQTKRQKQIEAIAAAVAKLGYPPMCIPNGGKRQVRDECKASRPDLFGGGYHPFLEAWQKAVGAGRIRMANHDNFSAKAK